MATSQDFANWMCSDELEPRFLVHLLIAENKALFRFASGATHQTIYYPELKALHICIPTVPEQKRIVAILDEAFEGISRAEENARKNLANARELFESYMNGVFSRQREGWPNKALQDLCESSRVITYGVIKLGPPVEGGTPCLRTSNVRWLRIETDGMKLITDKLSRDYKRTILRGGEVLVNVRGTLGGVAVASPDMAGWNVSREVAVVPSDQSTISSEFLAYWIGTKQSQDWLSGVLKGLAYTGINITDLRLLPVPLPAMSEQLRLVDDFDTAFFESRRLEVIYRGKILALAELKQSLLQKAFAGELTAHPEKAIEKAVA